MNLKGLFCGLFLAAAAVVSAQSTDYNWNTPDGVISGYWIWLEGYGDPKVALKPVLEKKPVNCTLSQGGKEELRAFGLQVQIPGKKDEWTTASFTFQVRSRRKGKVTLKISPWGNGRREKTNRDLFDLPDVGFMGLARISSPDIRFPGGGYFTSTSLSAWGVGKMKDKKMQPTVDTDKTLDTPSKKFVRLCQSINYVFDVKPDEEYTITITIKPLDYYKALH